MEPASWAMNEFAAGALTAAYLVAALFFLRFWRRSNDQLFLTFGFAFILLAVQQILLQFLGPTEEERSWVYLLRLVAFLAIIVAIVRKNMAR